MRFGWPKNNVLPRVKSFQCIQQSTAKQHPLWTLPFYTYWMSNFILNNATGFFVFAVCLLVIFSETMYGHNICSCIYINILILFPWFQLFCSHKTSVTTFCTVPTRQECSLYGKVHFLMKGLLSTFCYNFLTAALLNVLILTCTWSCSCQQKLTCLRTRNYHSQNSQNASDSDNKCEWGKYPLASVCELDSSMSPKDSERIC